MIFAFYLKLSKVHWHPLVAHVGETAPTMKTTALIYVPHLALLHYTTLICGFNTSSDLTEPKRVDQEGDPQHCRLW